MSEKNFYEDFKTWPAWKNQAKACKKFVGNGVTERTIKNWTKKSQTLQEEVHALNKKIKDKCSHPLKFQYVQGHDRSLDIWNENWVYYYYCDLCGSKLGEDDE